MTTLLRFMISGKSVVLYTWRCQHTVPRKLWSEKNNSNLNPRDFFRYDNNQNESNQFKKKIIEKFCKLSFKLALVLKSELLWYIEANYLSTVTPFF